jgi:hypothetical protein
VTGAMNGPDVLAVRPPSKALGVSFAVLAGSKSVVNGFDSKRRPACIVARLPQPAIHAAEYELAMNRECGDGLRLRPACPVTHLRQCMG